MSANGLSELVEQICATLLCFSKDPFGREELVRIASSSHLIEKHSFGNLSPIKG